MCPMVTETPPPVYRFPVIWRRARKSVTSARLERCSCMSELREARDERDVVARLHKLRVLLPAMAQETATARREAARLRSENRRLARRLAELEEALTQAPSRLS